MPCRFSGLVSNGGTGRIIAGKLGGKVGWLSGALLEGIVNVLVATSGSVCVTDGVCVEIDVNCKLEAVMNENCDPIEVVEVAVSVADGGLLKIVVVADWLEAELDGKMLDKLAGALGIALELSELEGAGLPTLTPVLELVGGFAGGLEDPIPGIEIEGMPTLEGFEGAEP